jgi:cell division protein FtsZ
MSLFEVDEAATRIREEVDDDAEIIVGAIFDQQLAGKFRVSVVATGLDQAEAYAEPAGGADHRHEHAAHHQPHTLQ